MADEVVCLLAPPNFQAVGQFYQDFTQVTDEEVMEALHTVERPQAPLRPAADAAHLTSFFIPMEPNQSTPDQNAFPAG